MAMHPVLEIDKQGKMTKLKDLCEFYKHKTARLEDKFSTLQPIIVKLGAMQKENSLMHVNLAAVTEELCKTQKAVSDMQVYLFREREENLRLSSENDQLKIENLEINRELEKAFKRDGGTGFRTKRSEAGDDSVRNSARDQLEGAASTRSREALELEINSLRTQLENFQTLHQNEVDVLLKDREVVAEERSVEMTRINRHISRLTASLGHAQITLQDAMKGFILEHEKYERDVEAWMEERNLMEKQIFLNECDKSDGRIICSSPRLSVISAKILQERLDSQEKLTSTYRQQCKQLQVELNKWRDQALSSEVSYREKVQQLTNELSVMKKRFEVLDRRRLSEAEGFRNDIKFLRQRVQDVSNTIRKFKSEEAIAQDLLKSKKLQSDDGDVRNRKSMAMPLSRATMFEKEVKELKKKLLYLSQSISCS